MADRFDPDPNKPGWGTFVNDQGKAVYDYFPNLAPPTSALSPSAAPTPAPLGTPASPYSSSAPQNMTPVAGAPPVVPAPAGTAPGATPRASKLVSVVNAATTPAPRTDGLVKTGISSSTSTTPGRSQANIERDKLAAREDVTKQQAANTQLGEQRRARVTEQARTMGAQAAGEQQNALNQEASAGIERYEARRKLSETLATKDPTVDPGRLMANLSTGKTVLTAILAGLSGGFGAIAGQKNNPVLDVINKSIENDIASQEQEIASGRISRGNLIQAYREQGMDARQAQQAARATYTDAARRVAQSRVDELGAAAHTEDAQALNAALETQLGTLERELDASGESRTTTTNGQTFERPKAASPEDALKQSQLFQARLEEMDSDEVARVISEPGKDGKQRPVSVKRAKAAVDGANDLAVKVPRADVAEQQLRNALDAAGVPSSAYNADTGTIDWSQVKDLNGVGMLDAYWGGLTNAAGLTYTDAAKVQDAAAALQESLTFLTTGATATKQQQETFKRQAGADARNEKAFKDNLSRTANQIATQRRSMLSGNPDATKLYEHNRGAAGGTSSLAPGVN